MHLPCIKLSEVNKRHCDASLLVWYTIKIQDGDTTFRINRCAIDNTWLGFNGND